MVGDDKAIMQDPLKGAVDDYSSRWRCAVVVFTRNNSRRGVFSTMSFSSYASPRAQRKKLLEVFMRRTSRLNGSERAFWFVRTFFFKKGPATLLFRSSN